MIDRAGFVLDACFKGHAVQPADELNLLRSEGFVAMFDFDFSRCIGLAVYMCFQRETVLRP